MEYQIIEKFIGAHNQGVMLCHLPDNKHHPYVTWRFHAKQPGRFWGHYFEALGEALTDYRNRQDDLIAIYQQPERIASELERSFG